jgi:hypothetical protein
VTAVVALLMIQRLTQRQRQALSMRGVQV